VTLDGFQGWEKMSGKAMFRGLENIFKGGEKVLPKLPDEVQATNRFWADIKRLLTKGQAEKDTVTFTQHTRGRALKRVGSQDTLVNSPIDEQVFRGRGRSNSVDSSWSQNTLIDAPVGKPKNLFQKFFGKSAEKSAIKAELKVQREELKALENGQHGIDAPKRNLPPIKSNMSSVKQETLRRLNFINAQKAELNTLKREIEPFYGQRKSMKSMEKPKLKIQKAQVEAEAILREMDSNLSCKDMLAHEKRQKDLEYKLFKINYNLDKLKYLEKTHKNMDTLSARLEAALERLDLNDSGIAMKREALESKNRVYSSLHTRLNVNDGQKQYIQEHMETVKNVVQEFENIIWNAENPYQVVERLKPWEAREKYYY
jgi:hypothetical protein